MLRTDAVAIDTWLKGTVRAALGIASFPRGYIQCDAANFSASGYAYADGAHMIDILGIRVTRLDALANDHRDYYAEGGTTLLATT